MKKILITFMIIILLAVGTVLYWQYDNVIALINGLNHSPVDIAKQIDENRESLKKKIQNYTKDNINDITAEDEQKLLEGELSVEDISEKYNLPIDVMTDDVTNNKDLDIIKDQNNGESVDKAVSEGVSKMYALKAKYVSKLGELERKVIDEYSKLSKEQQNEKSKYDLVMKNLEYVAELEKKCDTEVAEVLTTLEIELSKLNADKEIIQILHEAYENEKELKKSYYLSLYKK